MLIGFAFAALLLNSPAAIVPTWSTRFVLPRPVRHPRRADRWFEDIAPWIDFNNAQAAAVRRQLRARGEEWAQFAVSGLIWLVIPLFHRHLARAARSS